MRKMILVLLVSVGLNASFLPIHEAVMYSELAKVKELIEHEDVAVDAPTDIGLTPIHIAIKVRDLDMARYLLSKGADINAQDDNGITPLHLAVKKRRLELVKFLIENGAEINSKNSYGITPLHQAAFSDALPIVEYLVQMGADPLLKNSNGSTPYDLAMGKNNKEVASFLRYYNKKGK